MAISTPQPADDGLPVSEDPEPADEGRKEMEPEVSGAEESPLTTTEGFDGEQVGEPNDPDLVHDQAAQQPSSEAESAQASWEPAIASGPFAGHRC